MTTATDFSNEKPVTAPKPLASLTGPRAGIWLQAARTLVRSFGEPQGRPRDFHIACGCDRFDFCEIARDLQTARCDGREKVFEATGRQNENPSCTFNDDEGVLDAGGNVEGFSDTAFGKFTGTPEA